MHHIVDIGDLCLLRRPCTDRNYSYGGGVRRIPYIPNRNYSQQRKADRLIWLRNLDILGYTEKLTVLQYALEQYTNRDEGQDVPESVIEAFVVKIVVSKEGFDWYLRFDGDPDKPLHCQLQGKRKTNTKIMVSGDLSPAVDNSPTGCYQGLI